VWRGGEWVQGHGQNRLCAQTKGKLVTHFGEF
jgi:hypothetical protein